MGWTQISGRLLTANFISMSHHVKLTSSLKNVLLLWGGTGVEQAFQCVYVEV